MVRDSRGNFLAREKEGTGDSTGQTFLPFLFDPLPRPSKWLFVPCGSFCFFIAIAARPIQSDHSIRCPIVAARNWPLIRFAVTRTEGSGLLERDWDCRATVWNTCIANRRPRLFCGLIRRFTISVGVKLLGNIWRFRYWEFAYRMVL